jgi:hypothetical protein
MLTKFTPEGEYDTALDQCRILVETLPAETNAIQRFAIAFKGAGRPIDNLERARKAGFSPWLAVGKSLRVWRKSVDQGL